MNAAGIRISRARSGPPAFKVPGFPDGDKCKE